MKCILLHRFYSFTFESMGIKKYVLLAVVAMVWFASCKKSHINPGGKSVTVPDSSYLSITVNGTGWQTDSATVFNLNTADSGKYNLLITAEKNTAPRATLTMYITNYTGAATYSINPPFVSATYVVGNTRYYAGSGQIDITRDSSIMQGTFSFTADSLTVTNGTFYMPR